MSGMLHLSCDKKVKFRSVCRWKSSFVDLMFESFSNDVTWCYQLLLQK